MMNFRKELNKIKQEKLDTKNSYENAMTIILKQVLYYFSQNENFETSKEIEILFAMDDNNLYGKVYVNEKANESADFFVATKSREEALLVLVFLEQKFKNEKYKLLSGTSAPIDRCFSVIIDV